MRWKKERGWDETEMTKDRVEGGKKMCSNRLLKTVTACSTRSFIYLGLAHKPVRQLLRDSCYRDWTDVLNNNTAEGTCRIMQYADFTVHHT